VSPIAARAADPQALLEQALRAYRQSDALTASAHCQTILGIDAHHGEAWHLWGVVDLERGESQAALTRLGKAAELSPLRADFHKDLARAQFASGSLERAAASARRAIELDATDAEAWNVLGMSVETAEPAMALAAWQEAIALAPRAPEAHFRLGNFHRRRRDFAAAIVCYRTAVALGLEHPVVLNNLGLALQEQEAFVEAEQCYRAALREQPTLVEANANLGDLFYRQHRFAEAIPCYAQALAINANVAQLWANLGVCQHRIGALSSAQTSFERALALAPREPAVLINMASLLLAQQRYPEAVAHIHQALALQPGLAEAKNMLLYANQQTCQWEGLQQLFEEQRARLERADAPALVPHNLLALPYTPAELLIAARNWVSRHIQPNPAARPVLRELVGQRLRIAYVGCDFRTHPLANLLTEVIECHDRSRFEVFAYSFGPDDESAARTRFVRAFDQFVDVRAETFAETAQRIRDDRIAIVLDTAGYVIYARSEIFALRPAPIQINCIGFAATLGADYYDYILTDRFVSPLEQQVHFAERFMYLPHCYIPGDTKRSIGARPSRAECHLPEAGFVFCCFNASYKIHPRVFDVWMRLLEQIPGSVLWLLETNPTATDNLRREAQRRHVDADRLVFAPRLPLAQHLARHAVADLFLDTLPYNAHTTTNDALFAGLPVLTCVGETFASRVSGSHLLAIGLPELITDNLEDYEAVALRLARTPKLLAEYRTRLSANRATHPLFDTRGYTRSLEALLWSAWESYLAAR